MEILIFSALRNLFCSRMGSNVRKLLRIIKNDRSKPKLMILRKFCFFSEIFLKNFPILRCIRHFQRVEITWRGIERDENLVSKCSQRSHLYNELKSSNGGRWSKILQLFFWEKHRYERHHVVKKIFWEFFSTFLDMFIIIINDILSHWRRLSMQCLRHCPPYLSVNCGQKSTNREYGGASFVDKNPHFFLKNSKSIFSPS